MNKKQLHEKVLKVIKLKLEETENKSITKFKYANPQDKMAWSWKFELVDNEIKCFHTMRANPKYKHITVELNPQDQTNLMCFAELFFDDIKEVINQKKNKPKLA